MSSSEEIDKANKEKEEQIRKYRKRVASKKYIEEKEEIKRRSFTSFGKLLLSDEKSSPVISFPNAKKFNKAGAPTSLNTPGPIYTYDDQFKYKSPQKWSIGTGKRPPLSSCEKFEYYNHSYNDYKDFDLSTIDKKWKKTQGGAIGLDPKMKFELRECVPGSGRYEPSYKLTKVRPPAYFLGEKGNITSIKNVTGTNEHVGPGKYSVKEAAYTSKHKNPPHWLLPESVRKGLDLKVWTKNETYYIYK